MTDLRQKVEDDRGLLKKIELCIPGFRGYRLKEDLRIADSLLRLQIANAMKENVLVMLENVRAKCTEDMEIDLMNDVGRAIASAKTAEAKIRHAEEGYSGISPSYKVSEEQLNVLYEYDLDLINSIDNITRTVSIAMDSAEMNDYGNVKISLKQANTGIANLMMNFNKRIETMAGLGAF